jgi:hypothetical protein
MCFFVISGYLITQILAKENNKGTFTYYGFYNGRVKRIYPALIVVLFLVLYLSIDVLHLEMTTKTMAASTIFGASIEVLTWRLYCLFFWLLLSKFVYLVCVVELVLSMMQKLRLVSEAYLPKILRRDFLLYFLMFAVSVFGSSELEPSCKVGFQFFFYIGI